MADDVDTHPDSCGGVIGPDGTCQKCGISFLGSKLYVRDWSKPPTRPLFPSDLDAFRGMLERAGIAFEDWSANDREQGQRTIVVVSGPGAPVNLTFDASGALKRVDGGA